MGLNRWRIIRSICSCRFETEGRPSTAKPQAHALDFGRGVGFFISVEVPHDISSKTASRSQLIRRLMPGSRDALLWLFFGQAHLKVVTAFRRDTTVEGIR